MKRFVLMAVIAVLFAVGTASAQGIFNNSGSSSEDSLAVMVLSLDSLGRPTSADSFFIVVVKSSTNAAVFRDSGTVAMTGLDTTLLAGVPYYYYHRLVSDVDGDGAMGTYQGVITAKKNTGTLLTPNRFTFQVSFNELSDVFAKVVDTGVNVAQISGDATAADNFETMVDGSTTGLKTFRVAKFIAGETPADSTAAFTVNSATASAIRVTNDLASGTNDLIRMVSGDSTMSVTTRGGSGIYVSTSGESDQAVQLTAKDGAALYLGAYGATPSLMVYSQSAGAATLSAGGSGTGLSITGGSSNGPGIYITGGGTTGDALTLDAGSGAADAVALIPGGTGYAFQGRLYGAVDSSLLQYLQAGTAAGSGLDSATMSRIIGRKVWGVPTVAAGSGSYDSVPMLQRVVDVEAMDSSLTAARDHRRMFVSLPASDSTPRINLGGMTIVRNPDSTSAGADSAALIIKASDSADGVYILGGLMGGAGMRVSSSPYESGVGGPGILVDAYGTDQNAFDIRSNEGSAIYAEGGDNGTDLNWGPPAVWFRTQTASKSFATGLRIDGGAGGGSALVLQNYPVDTAGGTAGYKPTRADSANYNQTIRINAPGTLGAGEVASTNYDALGITTTNGDGIQIAAAGTGTYGVNVSSAASDAVILTTTNGHALNLNFAGSGKYGIYPATAASLFRDAVITQNSIAAGAISSDELSSTATQEIVDRLLSQSLTGYNDSSRTNTVNDYLVASTSATIADADMQSISNYVWNTTENPTRTVTSVEAIAAGAITATAVATGAIDADAIADNAIDAGAIATDAITAAKLADNTIDAGAIAANAITAAKIATDAITASQIAANAIGATEIGSDAITADKIAANAIGASEIADSAIDVGAMTGGLAKLIAQFAWRDSVTAQEYRLVNASATVSGANMKQIADSVWSHVISAYKSEDSIGLAGYYNALAGDTSLWATPTDMWANIDTAASIDTSDLGAWMIANMASGLTLQAIGDSVWRRVVSATDTAVAGSYAKVIPRIDNSQSWRVKALTLGPNTDSTNAVGFTVNGRGTRAGMVVEGGTAGVGVDISNGASATGAGLYVHSDAATYAGASFLGNTTGSGLLATGGASGSGMKAAGGASGGRGMEIDGGGTSGSGLYITAGSSDSYGMFVEGGGSTAGLSVNGGSGGGRGFEALGVGAPGIYAAAASGTAPGVQFVASGARLDFDADSTNIRSIPLTAQIWGADSATYQIVAATMASAASQTAATALTAAAVADAVMDTITKAPTTDTVTGTVWARLALNVDAKVSGAATQTWNATQMDSVLNAVEDANLGLKVLNRPFATAFTAGSMGDSLTNSTYIQGLRYLYTYGGTMTGEGAVQNLNEMLDGGTGGQLSLQASGAAPGLKITTSSATVPAVEVTSSAAATAAKFENSSSGIAMSVAGNTGAGLVLSSLGESPLYITTTTDTPGIQIYNGVTASAGRAKLIVDSVSGVGGSSSGGADTAAMKVMASNNPSLFYGPGLSGSGAYTVMFTVYDSTAAPDSTLEGITVNLYNSSGSLVHQTQTDGSGQTTASLDAGTYVFKSYDVGYQFDSVVITVIGTQSQTIYGADVMATSPGRCQILGYILNNNGDPLEGALVQAKRIGGKNAIATSGGTNVTVSETVVSSVTDQNGLFSMYLIGTHEFADTARAFYDLQASYNQKPIWTISKMWVPSSGTFNVADTIALRTQ